MTECLVYVIDRDDEKERLAFMLLDDGTYRFLLEYQEPAPENGYCWASNDYPGRYSSLEDAENIATGAVPWFRGRPAWAPTQP
ncbi:MAG TPA: hypothetical protein VFI23_06925 [Rhizomicrobium sp.]|nr:hypothetical protein [Rhizomicrobium sp.]